jgi:hypothetical protein
MTFLRNTATALLLDKETTLFPNEKAGFFNQIFDEVT